MRQLCLVSFFVSFLVSVCCVCVLCQRKPEQKINIAFGNAVHKEAPRPNGMKNEVKIQRKYSHSNSRLCEFVSHDLGRAPACVRACVCRGTALLANN